MRKTGYALIAILVLALTGSLVLAFATTWGIGISPDSTIYIKAARGLLAGKGFYLISLDGEWSPMTHFPPFFPLLLALMAFIKVVVNLTPTTEDNQVFGYVDLLITAITGDRRKPPVEE